MARIRWHAVPGGAYWYDMRHNAVIRRTMDDARRAKKATYHTAPWPFCGGTWAEVISKLDDATWTPCGDPTSGIKRRARISRPTAMLDPDIDQAELVLRITRFEQRRRRELALEAMPEPDDYDIRASHLLVNIGR